MKNDDNILVERKQEAEICYKVIGAGQRRSAIEQLQEIVILLSNSSLLDDQQTEDSESLFRISNLSSKCLRFNELNPMNTYRAA